MWLTVLVFSVPSLWALRLDHCASFALGMESGLIKDTQISASSSFDKQSVGPQNSRIRSELASGAWCPKPQIHASSYEFLQINLDRTHVITAIETQGRYGNGTGREFVTEYMIDYLRPGSKWIRYRNRTGNILMTGNFDTTTSVIRHLDPPVVASRIRIVPYSKQTRTICFRAELHGCVHKDGLLYYSTVPEGSRLGDLDFHDRIFEDSDLYTETGIRRGLGLLSDGFVADGSPFSNSVPNGSWIGWNKHHTGGTVTLLFEFDQLRNFTEILLAVFGSRMESIDVIFSQDGSTFPLSSQISSLDRLAANSTAKRFDLRVPLHKRMARKVRVTFKFSAEWLFLTEIHFVSVVCGSILQSSYRFFDFPTYWQILMQDICEYPLVSVLSNETMDSKTRDDQSFTVNKNIFSIIGLAVLFLILTMVLCGILCMRRKKSTEKANIFEQDIKRELIITQMGNKTATDIYPTQTYLSQYAGNQCASDKTTSTSVSSKSTSSNFKNCPPTWNDFHFPPPPETPEERIYAEPCMTLPLLPPQRNPNVMKTMDCQTIQRNFSSKTFNDKDLHYATGNLFSSSYGLQKIDKFPNSSLRFGSDLGEGKFTVVKECTIPGVGRVAYKCTKDKNNLHARKTLLDELKMLSKATHPHIVRLIGMDENAGIILEMMCLGDVKHFLKTAIEPVSMSRILSICADICLGMAHLESLGLVHGHLTPSNILLDNRLIAKVSSPRGPSHHAQLRYSAPESILANSFSCKSDIWAYAVCVWEISEHCAHLPFEGLSNTEIVENVERIMTGEKHIILPLFTERVPRGLVNILERCFDYDPPSRPSFSQIGHFISRFHTSMP